MKEIKSLHNLLSVDEKSAIDFIIKVIKGDSFYSDKRGGFELIAKSAYIFCKDLLYFNSQNTIKTKFGDNAFFEPDKRLIERDSYFIAQIKYALHQVTHTEKINGIEKRVFDKSKNDNFPIILLGIMSPDERVVDTNNEDKIYYYKKISGKKNSIIVFRAVIEKNGHIQYVTIMPDKSESHWKNYQTGENEKREVRYSPASLLNPLPPNTPFRDDSLIDETKSKATDISNTKDSDTNIQKDDDIEKLYLGGNITNKIALIEPYYFDNEVNNIRFNNGGLTPSYIIPEPMFEEGQVLDLKGYGKVKVLGSAWLTPPMTARPQYIYDFLLNPNAKITKYKRNDFSLYEYEVEMMLVDYDTGIDYEISYKKYLSSGLKATGNPPLSYISFIKIINGSLYYKNHPEFELNPPVKNFYEAYAINTDEMKYGGTVYNGVPVGYSIDPNLVISAFANAIDEEKVKEYTEIMKEQMLSHNFPTIKGFPIIIGEDDLGNYFMNGEEITNDFIGQRAWMVTDGHHRVLSALEAHLPHLEVELDYATVTDKDEFYKDGGQLKNRAMKKSGKRLSPKDVKSKVEMISAKIDEIKRKLKWHEGKTVDYPLTENEIKIINDGLPELRKERERIWKIYEGLKDNKQGTISDDKIQIKTFDINFNYAYRILDSKYIVNYLRLNNKQRVDDKFYTSYEIESTEKDIEKYTSILAEKMGNYSDYVSLMKIRTNEREKRFSTPQVLLQWEENNLVPTNLSDYLEGRDTRFEGATVAYSTSTFEIPREKPVTDVQLGDMERQAVRDVIFVDKYSKLTDEEAEFLYFKFKDYENKVDQYGEYIAEATEPKGDKKLEEFNELMETLYHKQFALHDSYNETMEAYQITIDFVNSVRGRIDTLKAKQSGTDLFPETEINILRKSDVENAISSLQTYLEIEPDNKEAQDAVESLKVLLDTSFDIGGEIDREVLEQSIGEMIRVEPDKEELTSMDLKAIDEALLLPNYKNLTKEEAEFIYRIFYNYETKKSRFGKYIYLIKWNYVYGSNDKNTKKQDEILKKFIEKLDKHGIITFSNFDGTIEAEKPVIDFVNSVRSRVRVINAKQNINDSKLKEEDIQNAIESLQAFLEIEPENKEAQDAVASLKVLLEVSSFKDGGEIKYYEVQKEGRPVLKAKFKKTDDKKFTQTSKMLDSLSDRGYALKEITEHAYRTFDYNKVNSDDMVEFTQGAEYFADGGKIEFDKNKIPSKRVYHYAIKIKREHPEIWKLGGNDFGNQAFKNLEKVVKRGYWLEREKWMFIKWQSYVRRHAHDYQINGVIAMMKWIWVVDKGYDYMVGLIEKEISDKAEKKLETAEQ